MEMKRSLIVPIPVCLDDLPVSNLRIFDKNLGICDSLPIRSTDIAFNREPMVSLVGGHDHGWEQGTLHCIAYESDQPDPTPSITFQTELHSYRSLASSTLT